MAAATHRARNQAWEFQSVSGRSREKRPPGEAASSAVGVGFGVTFPTTTSRLALCASPHDAAGSDRSGCRNARRPCGHLYRRADGSRSFRPPHWSGRELGTIAAVPETATAIVRAAINGFKIIVAPF